MKGRVVVWLLMLGVCGAHAMAADGLINVQSRFDPKDTLARLEAQVSARSKAASSD